MHCIEPMSNSCLTFDRAISVALVPVTIAPFVGGSLYPVMDATLCALLVLHTHIGFQYDTGSSSEIIPTNLKQIGHYRLLAKEARAENACTFRLGPFCRLYNSSGGLV